MLVKFKLFPFDLHTYACFVPSPSSLNTYNSAYATMVMRTLINAHHFNMQLDHFFAVGSPLAVFIMMREHDMLVKRGHKSGASILPTCVCKRIHNVHHPSDPVVSSYM